MLNECGIKRIFIYLFCRYELGKLLGILLIVILFLEICDVIVFGIRGIIFFIGSGVVYLLI